MSYSLVPLSRKQLPILAQKLFLFRTPTFVLETKKEAQ